MSIETRSLQSDDGMRKWSATRIIVLTSTLAMTIAATVCYVQLVAKGDGINFAEMLTIPLFVTLFAWIAFSFSVATCGFLSLVSIQHDRTASDSRFQQLPAQLTRRTSSRTAVLVPVYNESPQQVFACIEAMVRDLSDHGAANRFDFYVLSDSTDTEIWLREEQVWSAVSDRLKDQCNIFYRHRPRNVARKSGNIADFCTRWGSRYPLMIVLDADSLMSATTMMEMVSRMQADPSVGILQVPPTPIGRRSVFARVQQFSAQAYGPVFVEGFAKWAGDDGNYWGHNAIIRVDAFLQHCDLPVLPGKAPLGGEILSHDFVEAALMLRGGWKVRLATDLDGSYEECPTTLADYAQRDQRWCQGNLQHAKLLVAEGYHALSRFHFASGVLSYAASPLWVAFTLLTVVGMVTERYGQTAPGDFHGVGEALLLFGVSLSLLLLPKLFSVIAMMLNPRVGGFGGRLGFVASSFFEIVFSVLLSPIMAMFHSRFVIATLTGTAVQWGSQQRNEHAISWREALAQFRSFTLVGLGVTAVLYWVNPGLLVWFSPIVAGLILSIPIAKIASSVRLGVWLRNANLLLIPEEQSPPPVVAYRQDAVSRLADASSQPEELFEQVVIDPSMHQLHQRIQLASEACVAMSDAEAEAVAEALSTGGPRRIPPQLRGALLRDNQALQKMHVDSHLASWASDTSLPDSSSPTTCGNR